MKLVSDECANILCCNVKSLRDLLNHPENRLIILKTLCGRKVRTTYEDRNGEKKSFLIGGITKKGANFVPAYGRLSKPFNISVTAHFYARHRIRLINPYHHCIIEKFTNKKKSFKENRYYPMELLELINEDETITDFCGNSKKSQSSDSPLVIMEDDDSDEQTYPQLSQPKFTYDSYEW
ncbi:unnamed protein product [Meloidogyne enterolobii]|uniref:Uncharacterized protein n=1 Tax=Meloidogyne enterolobii TaxID=390850 RepID=A0ACB0ZT62_MELEN